MLYFKDPADTKQLGVISLAYPMDKDGALTRTVETFDDAKRKNCFTIKGKQADQRSYNLSAESLAECKEWMEVCKRVIYTPMGGGMFGCELWDQVVKEHRGPDTIPIIVEKCIRYLTANGLTEPGIFRLPGRTSRVEELRESFNRGEDPDISDEKEVHAVGSLLKRYLRELPNPLLSAERFSAFNSAADVYEHNPEEGLLVIKQLIRDLPVCNAVLLKAMCEFLSKVAAHSDENKMDTGNLAVVFSPGFLAPPADASNEDLIKNQSTSQMVTRILIEHPEDVYAMMPTPDAALMQLFRASRPSRRVSSMMEHDLDDEDEGDEGEDAGGMPAKPALPSEAVLAKTRQVITALGSSRPTRRSSSTAHAEQKLALELAKERGQRQHLEAEIRALRLENDSLKEELAAERAARMALTGKKTAARRSQSMGGGHAPSRGPLADVSGGGTPGTLRKKGNNPFRDDYVPD